MPSPDPVPGKSKTYLWGPDWPERQEVPWSVLPYYPNFCQMQVTNNHYIICAPYGATWRQRNSTSPLNADWHSWHFDSSSALFDYILEYRRLHDVKDSLETNSEGAVRLVLNDGFIYNRPGCGFQTPYKLSPFIPSGETLELAQNGDTQLPKILVFKRPQSERTEVGQYQFDRQATEIINGEKP